MEDAQVWMDRGVNFAVEYGPKVLGAILIYIIGSWVIKKIVGAGRRMMAKSNYEESLQKFLLNLRT